jgi:hypothetical protein
MANSPGLYTNASTPVTHRGQPFGSEDVVVACAHSCRTMRVSWWHAQDTMSQGSAGAIHSGGEEPGFWPKRSAQPAPVARAAIAAPARRV